MKVLTPLLCVCLIFQANISMSQDTLITFQEITFRSDFEKTILEDYFLHHKKDYFGLALANGQTQNQLSANEQKERFLGHLNSLNNEKFKAKNNAKKVKLVYDDVHATYLTKYELENRFEDIFKNGFYNCVSATFLYGLAFETLGIPYHILEKPTHVYLVAYPQNESIVVETTAPASGFFSPGEQFKANYLKVLRDQKIISVSEFNSTESNQLFDKYYFGDLTNISLSQLAGLQYFNEGLYLTDKEEFLDALHQFEKAYLLYPSERTGYMLMVSAYNAFSHREKPDSVQAICLGRLSQCTKYGVKNEMVEGEFAKVTERLLFDEANRDALDKYYRALMRAVKDEPLRKQLAFIYQYENARSLHNQSKFKDAIPYIEEAMKLRPNNQDGNSLFLACLFKSLRNVNGVDLISALESYNKKYPWISNNDTYCEALASTYLVEFDRNFQLNNAATGEHYRQLFEKFKKDHAGVTVDDRLLAEAYLSAAVYYFRKGQDAKAKSVINAGLVISPNNYELMSRKKMLDQR